MTNDFMINLGIVVKKSRQNLGMTQADLGAKVDRPQSSIARLESGQLGDTHFGFIIDLATALNMDVEDLIAATFGRKIPSKPKALADKSELLQKIKNQLRETDPLTRKLIGDLFFELTNWIKEVPKVPEIKK